MGDYFQRCALLQCEGFTAKLWSLFIEAKYAVVMVTKVACCPEQYCGFNHFWITVKLIVIVKIITTMHTALFNAYYLLIITCSKVMD